MMTVDEALRHERDRLQFELEWDSIYAMETLAAEVRRQRREIEMLLEQRNDHMKGSADATTACIEYQQVIAELREENERQRFDILAMNQSLDLMREENERRRKDAERYRWLSDDGGIHSLPYDDFGCGPVFDLSREAIDAARGGSSQAQNTQAQNGDAK